MYGDATLKNVHPNAAKKKAPPAHSEVDDRDEEMAIKALKAVEVWTVQPSGLINQDMRLVEAEKDSEWYVALLLSDCKSLLKLLKEDERLVRYTGHEGRTILHAAARRGCEPLVDQIMQLFKHEGQFLIEDTDKRVLLEYLFQAKDTKTKLRAVEIMEYFMGSRAIREPMKEYYSKALTRLSSNVDGHRDGAERNMEANEGEIKDNGTSGYINIDPQQSSEVTLGNDNDDVGGKPGMHMNMAYFMEKLMKRSLYEVVNKGGIGQYLKNKMLQMRWFQNFSRDKVGEHDLGNTMPKEKEPNTTCPSSPTHDAELEKIRHIIARLLENGEFADLQELYTKDKDYNFDEGHPEYMFHYACRIIARSKGSAKTFITEFIKECLELGGDVVLQCLFKLRNWQGNTPCHVALAGSGRGLETLLNLLPKGSPSSNEFINAYDARGWTPLHKVVAIMGGNESWKYRRLFWLLLNDGRIKVNIRKSIRNSDRNSDNRKSDINNSDITPLHLAILHNLPKVVEMLIWKGKDIDMNILLKRKIKYTSTMARSTSSWWSPLQLAAVMGQADIVKALLTKVCSELLMSLCFYWLGDCRSHCSSCTIKYANSFMCSAL